MATSELVLNRSDELTNSGKAESTKDFYVFRMPRSDRGVSRGQRKAKVVAKVAKGKRGVGRPRVYNGQVRRQIAAALKRLGYTNGLAFLRKERKLKVSLTLARSVAEENGITFVRGRPKEAA